MRQDCISRGVPGVGWQGTLKWAVGPIFAGVWKEFGFTGKPPAQPDATCGLQIVFFMLIVWGAGEDAHEIHRTSAFWIKRRFDPVEGSE
jgi:hypothetical protein